MSFLDHLEELRKRILHAVVWVGLGFSVAWWKSPEIFEFLARPLKDVLPAGEKLTYLRPTDPFMLYMQVGLLGGIFLASPGLLWELWCFISPALYRKEKRLVGPFIVFGVALFLTGGWFGYSLAYPRALSYLISLGGEFRPMITIDAYFDITWKIILGLGLVFEIPVVIFFLARLGIVTPGFLLRNFRYAVIVIAILSAILTPTPDIANMLIFMAPMAGLYLLGTLVAFLFARPRPPDGEKGS
jgi:sec-independent protein translocase protein TatC